MKTSFTTVPQSRLTKLILIGWLILILVHLSMTIYAGATLAVDTQVRPGAGRSAFNFPKSVARYYQAQGAGLSWVEHGKKNPNTEMAMMLLDCVRQFGLDPLDYHPQELLYSRLKLLQEYPGPPAETERRHFDELLTDAVLTMMNHLHYGKFNPFYAVGEIDNGGLPHFNADFVLFGIVASDDFYTALVKVQPQSRAYGDLQKNMQLVLSQYILDSYEYPQANVRKMAINMERLRWLGPIRGNSIQVNIPSYQLKLRTGDKVDLFRVVVGDPENPTPTFQGTLTRFTAAPEWKVPAELFVGKILPAALKDPDYLEAHGYSIYGAGQKRIRATSRKLGKISRNPAAYSARQSPNNDNMLGKVRFRVGQYPDGLLFDHRDGNVFHAKQRAISKGCIQVENPELLARLLLIADGAADQVGIFESAVADYRYRNFYLKKAVPIAVTYLTCEMIDSRLMLYKDIYQMDAELEAKLFGGGADSLADGKIKTKAVRNNDVKTFRR